MAEARPWHRLFALSLVDFFRGTPVSVEFEKDLSLKQQFLDVVLIHKKDAGPLTCRLPDGLEDLAAHNLVTFKSYQEALDGWALNELVGHYVNYRKQISPSMQDLLAETDFKLFAVSVRFPQNLARQGKLTPIQPGVYEAQHFTGSLRLIVVHELPQEEHNALLHLFSAQADLLSYGANHYRLRSQETSNLLLRLFERYHLEVTQMPDMLEEFTRESIEQLLRELPMARRLKGVTADDLVAALPPETLAALAARLQEKGVVPTPPSNEPKPPDAR